MSGSIALSVIIFLCFGALAKPEFLGMRAIRPYTADLSLAAEAGIGAEALSEIAAIPGVKRAFGRRSALVQAGFDESRLAPRLQKGAANGAAMLDPSWLLSYDATQLRWAREYLREGTSDEAALDSGKGIIAVRRVYRSDKLEATAEFEIGDEVVFMTEAGPRRLRVMGKVDALPYSSASRITTAFVTTEGIFAEFAGRRGYTAIDVQLERKNGEAALPSIKARADAFGAKLLGKRQLNAQARNAFLTVAVFIYGFVAAIALIGALNIANTMNCSVAAKTRQIGVLRAIGMSGAQLRAMIMGEALCYAFSGCVLGSVLGLWLRKALLDFLGAEWGFPFAQVLAIFAFAIAAALASTLSPLRRIEERGIPEVIASL